ncbi:DNA repair protein Rad7, protein [Aspergillus clavatus NRRL 1]|uniref:DNA repair protein Rad7, protein n=1 Tax=Aspergillus clavatus (strain ATCC 1007 / CBS 513.65 / DSM 816 / NCTC 3887 / NRRL 1 / QM 1276 / 107) TaxID=344612 RepID=A1CD70_ASPCL|nr:DNA repair protein Rad7, protein [Aspergillus clavatus NRRL 1]EAW11797.1 DNA repair protein Rad7, protein [Aspergillus clavatus NRRL 1]
MHNSNNISAAQIHQDYQRRVREADQDVAASETQNEVTEDEEYEEDPSESAEQRKKRKRKEAAALARIKQSKEFARRKSRRTGEPDGDGDLIAREMMHEKSRPLPGQLENCELCSKRFTVTPYSKTGPNGGLLCAKCSKEIGNDEKKSKAKKRGPRTGRRQNQSNLLDGVASQGALSLVEMCTKKVADNHNEIEEFGDLPSRLLHRLSQIFSKRRILTPRTLNLFLRPELNSIDIYDAAKLETDDFHKIFAIMPALMRVNLRFAGQIKDRVIEYMLDRDLKVRQLQLDAANLVSDSSWQQLFQKLGSQLESVKLSNLDYSFTDETVERMCESCVALQQLKLKQCWKLGNDSLSAISTLSALEHLSLDLVQETSGEVLLQMISTLAPKLRTLSLEGISNADDRLLDLIHEKCLVLAKLRLTDNSVLSDKGFVNLFTDWANAPLKFVDFSSTRDVDNSNPDGPADAIGFASQGFIALMNHSGSTLRKLNISSCRHISHAAFEEVFTEGKSYPFLQELDISFLTVVDDFLMGRVFRCCPSIKKVVAFACFNVRQVHVPIGVALIGGLKAQDSIVIEGTTSG